MDKSVINIEKMGTVSILAVVRLQVRSHDDSRERWERTDSDSNNGPHACEADMSTTVAVVYWHCIIWHYLA